MSDKVLALFAYPLGLALLGLIAALLLVFWGARKTGLIAGLIVILALWTCATPLFAHWLAGVLEDQYPAQKAETYPASDVAILLGGAAYSPNENNPYGDLTEAGDRVLHAYRVLKAGRVSKILISGGNLFDPEHRPEAEAIADMLVSLGIDRTALMVEGRSRNTYENAVESAEIWRREGFKSALLVTSAVHMRRALAVFRKAGFAVEPAATDFLSAHPVPPFPLSLLPRAESLSDTTNVVKELLGLLVYRWRGWA
jgi:uncharacterized SAM-binding protein YcdF (DUF218 family)